MKKILVRNDSSKPGRIQSLVLNLLPKLVRHDKMEDRDYLVVPMVILTEGVHAGSNGPMLYPSSELSKTPVSWNHKPVVVYHPEMNGQGVSACDPSVITNRKVGVMMNTKYEKGKLKSEAWIEVTRANLVDDRIMAAIEANQMMEVSTGVFVDLEEEPGEWKGETYIGTAKNYRPDHLALLPDKIGACSIKDGAGFLRNQAGEPGQNQVVALVQKILRDAGLTENAMSHGNIRDALGTALRARFKTGTLPDGPFLFVESVYDDFVIYEVNQKLFRLGYSATDTEVTLSTDAPAEVVRVTEYRTVAGAFVGNQHQNKPQETHMNKKELVDAVITANAGYKEEHREDLMALTEKQLESMIALHKEMPTVNFQMEKKDGKAPVVTLRTTAPAPAATPAPAPVAPIASKADSSKVLTLEEYIQAAPAQVQAVLNNSLAVYEEEKGKLVDQILSNKNNPFAKEDLSNRPLGELRNLARLSGVSTPAPRQPNYAGQGSVPTENAGAEEPLMMPAVSFAK